MYSSDYFSSLNRGKEDARISAEIVMCILTVRFYWHLPSTVRMVKVAAVIRVTVGRSVIPIEVGKAVIGTVVPVAPKADSTNSVGIDEVRIAPSIPHQFIRGVPLLSATPTIHPQYPV